MHHSASDLQTIAHPQQHQLSSGVGAHYYICICGNLNPDLFAKLDCFTPKRDAISNTYMRVCKLCQFPVAEREGYAYCPMCNHESESSFRRLSLRPGDQITLCLVCNSAVATALIEAFFNLIDCQTAQLKSVSLSDLNLCSDNKHRDDSLCPQCTLGRLKFSLDIISDQVAPGKLLSSASYLQLVVTCSSCSATYILLDEPAVSTSVASCQGNGAKQNEQTVNQLGHNDVSSLDCLIAPYLCDRCPGSSFDKLHPVDHRRGGNSVSASKMVIKSTKVAKAEQDEEYESLYCVSCESVIPLYVNDQSGGPATLADLRRCVQPRYSTGRAGQPIELELITDARQLQPGDHVCFPRKGGVYWHHGIVASIDRSTGDNQSAGYSLLHYNNYTEADVSKTNSWWQWLSHLSRLRTAKGVVRVDSMDLVKEPRTFRLTYHNLDCYPPDMVVQRALSQLLATNYNLLGENCEHLAVWAKSGEARSLQVENIHQLVYRFGSHVLALSRTASGLSNRVKLAASESLDALLKLRQCVTDLMKQRISPLMFSRRLWRMLIRTAFVMATSTLLRLIVPNAPGVISQQAATGVGGALGGAVADMLLPETVESAAGDTASGTA